MQKAVIEMRQVVNMVSVSDKSRGECSSGIAVHLKIARWLQWLTVWVAYRSGWLLDVDPALVNAYLGPVKVDRHKP